MELMKILKKKKEKKNCNFFFYQRERIIYYVHLLREKEKHFSKISRTMRVSFDEGNILTRDNDYAGWGFYLIFFYIPFNLKNVIFRFNFKRFHALRARYNFRTGYTRMIHQESAYVDK